MKKTILTVIITAIICISGTVLAVSGIHARDISYTDKNNQETTVQAALNDLYTKSDAIVKIGDFSAVQVGTLTAPNQTYTMQNDGIITGTAQPTSGEYTAKLYLNDDELILSYQNIYQPKSVSIYAAKNTVVKTRTDGGAYNLTIYEFK